MSWEDHERTEVCYCGRGKLIERWRSDDWGRVELSPPEMNCKTCAELFHYIKVGHSSEDWEPRMAWVRKLGVTDEQLIKAGIIKPQKKTAKRGKSSKTSKVR